VLVELERADITGLVATGWTGRNASAQTAATTGDRQSKAWL